MRRGLLFLACLPPNLAGWAVLGVLMLVGAAEVYSSAGGYLCARSSDALGRRWHFSTTLGPAAVLLHPSADDDCLAHELVHCKQAEGVSLAWGAAALASWSWRMVALWPLAWLIVYLGASVAAWLSGRPWYMGNTFEGHAYAIEAELRARREELHVQPNA